MVEGARANGATKITGIDFQDSKKKIGDVCGITPFINPSQINEKPIWEAIQDITRVLGVDCALDCTGAPGILNQALTSTKIVGHSQSLIKPKICCFHYLSNQNQLI